MANKERMTEHSGPKQGRGAFYGRKAEAKDASNRRRRQADKRAVVNESTKPTATSAKINRPAAQPDHFDTHE